MPTANNFKSSVDQTIYNIKLGCQSPDMGGESSQAVTESPESIDLVANQKDKI